MGSLFFFTPTREFFTDFYLQIKIILINSKNWLKYANALTCPVHFTDITLHRKIVYIVLVTRTLHTWFINWKKKFFPSTMYVTAVNCEDKTICQRIRTLKTKIDNLTCEMFISYVKWKICISNECIVHSKCKN